MKKKIALVIGVILLFSMNCIAYASVDDVNSFLSDYQTENNTFLIEEHCSADNNTKTLFIQANLSYDTKDDKYMNFVNNERDIFKEMSTKEWFDYEVIYLLNFSGNSGRVYDFKEYNLSEGTLIAYGYENVIKLPWIIKTKEELDDSTINFLGNVTEELLFYHVDDYIGENPGGIDFDDIEIKESNGIAEVSGNVKSGGKDYKFVTQFTYEIDEGMNGTYNALYVGLNDVPVYGEYEDISNIKLN